MLRIDKLENISGSAMILVDCYHKHKEDKTISYVMFNLFPALNK